MDAIAPKPPVGHVSAQHKLFWVAVSLKFLNGVVELLSGTALIAIPEGSIASWVHSFFDGELASDPNNVIANWMTHWVDHLQHHDVVFVALYLIFRGCAKIALSTMLLKGIEFAYPMAIGAFSLIDLWGIQHLIRHFSWPLAALVALDVFVIAVITREWLTEVKHRGPTSGPGHA